MGMKDESATFAIFGTITRGEKTKKKRKRKSTRLFCVRVRVFPVVLQAFVFINRECVALWLPASAKGDDNKGLAKS